MDIDLDTTAENTSRRKREHLEISLTRDTGFREMTTGLEKYRFLHQALPEIDRDNIVLGTELLGKKIEAPLVLSSMVGGIEEAGEINLNLARAAQELDLAMGVGSQRCMLEDPSLAGTYRVRDVAPDILLFANLGAVQLNNGYGVSECRRAVEAIEADALVLHLNPLQEALQPEGNTNFAGLLDKIETVCRELPVPVIVKEVGWGISGPTARRLSEAGVAAIDVAGAGGTNWGEVEGYRSVFAMAAMAASFASWGIPTAESIRMCREAVPDITLIASGGIRTGLDVAKAIALGASVTGLGSPLLRPAAVSPEAVISSLRDVIEDLRTTMFCIGAGDLDQLRGTASLIAQGGKDG